MTQLSQKQLSENAKFIASTYTKGSVLNKIYLQRSRMHLFKSIIKFEWLLNPKNYWIESKDIHNISEKEYDDSAYTDLLSEDEWDATKYGYTIDENGYKPIEND